MKETEDGRIEKSEATGGRMRRSRSTEVLGWIHRVPVELKSSKDEKRINWNLVPNRGADEVKESDITPEEWPRWKIADGDEWTKVAAPGAVVPVSEEEPRKVERQA